MTATGISPHPGPSRAALPQWIRVAIVAHARAEYPNEACGLIAGTAPAAEGGTATAWHATRNRAASPLRYEIHPEDLLRVSLVIDDADEVIWGIVHSHVRSPARPSPTDVGLALYPDALYLLVSLSASEVDPATGAGSIRAWRIVDGGVHEVTLEIAPGDWGRSGGDAGTSAACRKGRVSRAGPVPAARCAGPGPSAR